MYRQGSGGSCGRDGVVDNHLLVHVGSTHSTAHRRNDWRFVYKCSETREHSEHKGGGRGTRFILNAPLSNLRETMEPNIAEIAERIKAMRELCEIPVEEMAEIVGKTPEEYVEYESGRLDFSFTFLHKCAERFGIDIVELLTGENPHLSGCTLVRKGKGLPIKRRIGFEYEHLAYNFKDKLSETFLVTAPYIQEDQDAPIRVSTHEGQEFDYILEGNLRFSHNGHVMDLGPGDSVYYDSGKPHGMYATSKEGCRFIAVVMKG